MTKEAWKLYKISVEGGYMSVVKARNKASSRSHALRDLRERYPRGSRPEIISIELASEVDRAWVESMCGYIEKVYG